ncbi:type IV pili methyl-accepting chemotaxis transducer N-terminal domain-containing protein [Pseudaestuariivita rosea]|uniref:type IV pili methyl-accepting chemotaxis transducer N-terminal domain-containing protein n=1 Tax=Pseudaestuariivita rosea TaxID=2763263 RepID=UPI001ABB72A6|nr:type IV pili methyl-accepting chemotaxis transducer N-terminal domain-containing protein [Pseudaestuariivita rosea]
MRPTLKLSNFLAIVAISFTTSLPVSVQADGPFITAEQAARKVNVAGRQRMLSQRIAKAACFTARGIEPNVYRDQLIQARDLFEQSQDALRYGSLEMKLLPEIRPSVLLAQSEVLNSWSGFRAPVNEIVRRGYAGPKTLSDLQTKSLTVLRDANEVVYKTAMAYGGQSKDVSLGLTLTVDIAGRQRMLSQKMVKEVCLMGLSETPAAVAETLTETVRLFDASLTALKNGYADAGIIPAPTSEIAAMLDTVSGQWVQLKPYFDAAAAGEIQDASTLTVMERQAEILLRDMNRAVGMYENI